MWPVFLTAMLLGLTSAGFAVAQTENPAPTPRTITVALDGSGDFASIQEAVDSAGKGDTVFIKAGTYAQDLTIHSKEQIKIAGAGVDKTILSGRGTMVGVLHVGKWPYGAADIDISGLTINEHGGHALGIFNGTGITLHHLRVNGMVFGQQVHDVRIEDCIIGGSETTGVHVTDSQVQLVGNFIHDNDYGVNVTGKSNIRLDRNIITRSLFEAIVVNDQATADLIQNTLVKNGGGAAFLGSSTIEASGNIVSFNNVGFLIAASSQTKTSYNALFNSNGNYVRAGSPNVPAPELQAESDMTTDPRFVDIEHDDFRLKPDTSLLNHGAFRYLGALPPLLPPAHNRQ
jgi:hypothetical protein